MLRAAAAKNDPFNLAIIDMHMPDMDGATLIETIKSDRALSDARIILLTSLSERIASEELKSVGVDDCVTKPARHSRLFDSIATVMLGEVKRDFSPRPAVARTPSAKVSARILLAEDNTINQRVALGQLQELGYTADIAANGLEVLRALEQIPYDLILMDCQMPEMDGYESAEVIRRREKERPGSFKAKSRLHIIAMTANAMQGDRERCLAAGMDDYITKPVEVEELSAALGRWGGSARSASEKIEATERAPSKSEPAASAPVPAAAPALALQPVPGPAVDLRRLRRLTQDDPTKMREMLELYLDQGENLVQTLEQAVKDQSTKDIHFMAHKLGGSSANCGMIAIVGPLRELEALGYKGQVAGADALYQQVRSEWARIRTFVAEYFDGAHKG
jgi:CheY-like chemotaxis protein